VALFAEDRLEADDNAKTSPAHIFEEYKDWCKQYSFSVMSRVTLGKRLGVLGFVPTRSGGKDYWKIKIVLKDYEAVENVVYIGPRRVAYRVDVV
jgi:hypothetical protein